MAQAAFCIATTVNQASRIVADLRRQGFDNDDISVLYSDTGSTRDFAHTTCSKAPEGAMAGAGTGGVLGATLGWFVGIGSLAIPGVGPFIAAGPILSALGCMGLGATIGGISGALVGYGIPEFEAKRYEGKVVGGGILVSVHVDGRAARRRAYEVFARHDAEDISVAEEARADFPVPHAPSA
jgi:outer membrane lipoprotein SlyB